MENLLEKLVLAYEENQRLTKEISVLREENTKLTLQVGNQSTSDRSHNGSTHRVYALLVEAYPAGLLSSEIRLKLKEKGFEYSSEEIGSALANLQKTTDTLPARARKDGTHSSKGSYRYIAILQ